jgi:hypothetical protein
MQIPVQTWRQVGFAFDFYALIQGYGPTFDRPGISAADPQRKIMDLDHRQDNTTCV